MLDFIRHHQRLVQVLLAVLVFPSFIFLGVANYTGFLSNEVIIAKVGDTKITRQEFDNSWRQELDQLRQKMGANFNISKVDTRAARENWLQQLIDARVIHLLAKEGNFTVSTHMLQESIGLDPNFQVNGVFNQQRYLDFLRFNRITAQQYQNYVASQLVDNQVVTPVSMSADYAHQFMAHLQNVMLSSRTVQIKSFPYDQYRSKVKITEPELQQWYDAHKEDLRIPENLDVQFILLDQAVAEKAVDQAITDSQMKDYYDQNKKHFVTPERREISHIQLSIPANADAKVKEEIAQKAQQLAHEATADNFAALAKKYSDDAGSKNNGGRLGFVKMNEYPGLSDKAYALQLHQVSQPILYHNAWHIVLVTTIEPGHSITFAEAKPQILKEIRLQLASDKFASLAEQLKDQVYENHDGLKGIAGAVNLPIQTIKGVVPQGILPSAHTSDQLTRIFTTPKVLQVIFSKEVYKDHQNSGVIEVSPSEQLVVHIEKVNPSHIPTFEQDKKLVTQYVQHAKEVALAQAEAERYTGNDFAAPIEISRVTPQGLSTEEVNTIMNLKIDQLPVTAMYEGGNAYQIVKIVKTGQIKDAEATNFFTQNFTPRVQKILAAQEAQAYLRGLRQQVKVEIKPESKLVLNPDNQ